MSRSLISTLRFHQAEGFRSTIESRYFLLYLSTITQLLKYFQIAKQILKVDGQPVFEKLLTATNEYGQIVICDLVPTKAHSQFDIALSCKQDSINTFGLPSIQFAFTDNPADKPMLEHHFPSLLDGIQPISSHSSLPHFQIPNDVTIHLIWTASQIQYVILSLLDRVPPEEQLIVGLDMEWNIDLEAQRHGISQPKQVALFQLAHGRYIYLIQVLIILYFNVLIQFQFSSVHMLRTSMQLVTFLSNPQILKVGRNVKLDLQGGSKMCHPPLCNLLVGLILQQLWSWKVWSKMLEQGFMIYVLQFFIWIWRRMSQFMWVENGSLLSWVQSSVTMLQ